MHGFYKKALAFWIVLLVLAFANATIREFTYKPWLTPYIGTWAHQVSSLFAIVLFYIAIYFFLRKSKEKRTQHDLFLAGLMWITMTIGFESVMNILVRHLTFQEVMQTYYVWKGETWPFVLLSLLVSPVLAERILQSKHMKDQDV